MHRLVLLVALTVAASVCADDHHASHRALLAQTEAELAKPSDASDVHGNSLQTIEYARGEIVRLRGLIKLLHASVVSGAGAGTGSGESDTVTAEVRADGEAEFAAPDMHSSPALTSEEAAKTQSDGDNLRADTQTQVCTVHHSCEACVSAGCGWCLGDRKCVDDIAWVCNGDVDHIGKVGKTMTCPDKHQLQEERAERRKRAAAAKAARTPATLDGPGSEDEGAPEADEMAGDESVGGGGGESGKDGAPTPPAAATADASAPALTPKEVEERRKQLVELKKRAKWVDLGYGTSKPYDVLVISSDATPSQIRKAYRKLSLQFHPDKAVDAASRTLAEVVFQDIVKAYELLGDPDKRAAFDDFGSTGGAADGNEGTQGFQTFWEYEQSNQKFAGDFYNGHNLITNLREAVWERRMSHDSIWVIEFYAPWCSHCQQMVSQYKAAAKEMEQDPIDFGAINCEKEPKLCGDRFNIKSYPTLKLVNANHGMQQEFPPNVPKDANGIATWAREVATEWRYLFSQSNVKDLSAATFSEMVIKSKDFWVILFVDGLECGPCKTAKTNMMRLSAGLRGLAQVGVVDCDDPENSQFCVHDQGIPSAPHAPVSKAWKKGNKTEGDRGEILWNNNEVEPHIALELTERAVRLALSQDMVGDTAVSGGRSEYSADEKDEDTPPPPPPPPRPMWSGPARRQAVAWDNGGGRGQRGMLGH